MEPLALVRSLAALLLVLGILAALAWLARRLDLARRLGGGGSAGTRGARLALVESRWLDSRTRLLLVRCDGREHLVLTTPAGALQLSLRGGSSQAPTS
jgi:flagellar protein FliO/FliZ